MNHPTTRLLYQLKDFLRPVPRPVENCALITGLPRSGTTLTCHLLNKTEDAIALHEPMHVKVLAKVGSPERALHEVHRFLRKTRTTLIETGHAPTKHIAGQVPDNPVGLERTDAGLRRSQAERGDLKFSKPLADDFLLAVKHPAAFSALLPQLVQHYPVFGVVRNPLSVLCSWNTVDLSIQDGHIPAAEDIDCKLRHDLNSIPDRIDRQLYLLDWFFGRFQKYLPADHILRYEDTVATGGRSLAVVAPNAAKLEEALDSRNKSSNYGSDLIQSLGERLLESDGEQWGLYDRDAVKMLMAF